VKRQKAGLPTLAAVLLPLLLGVSPAAAAVISGTVFEDVNYGGGAGRSLVGSSGVLRAGAIVELYDSAGAFLTSTATDVSGNYSFPGLSAGNYTVRVVNSTVTSSRTGYVAGLLAVQTYRTDASTGSVVAVTNDVGGQNPAVGDAGLGSPGTVLDTATGVFTAGIVGTAQSITNVALGATDIAGVDFGFNFDTIVNVNDSSQGSLRQFLTNANALANPGLAQVGRTAGIDNAVFEIPGPGPHSITLATWLPSITNPVVLDGTTQPGFSGTPIIELDGSATTYGTGLDAGLKILAGNSTVRGLVINRFAVDGIRLETGSNNVVEGNYIGTDLSGLLDRGNVFDGVFIVGGSSGNRIGGLLPGQGNVISGNNDEGLDLRTGSANKVQGNLIGIGADGTTLLGNVSDGVQITGGTGHAVTANRIAANGGLGIDLRDDGVTLNDALDVDTGPNDVLNFPAIASAVPSAGTLTVYFQLDVPAGSYRLEFFKNPSGVDASGYGEGEIFASSTNLTHPGGAAIFFNYTFAGNTGDVITATTTACTDGAVCSAFGNTSEFSNAVTAAPTAVKLLFFEASGSDEAVGLTWRTGSELDNLGFHLYRSSSASGPWTRITSSLIPGLGSSPLGASYSWRDSGLVNGRRYFYRLEDVDASSKTTSHGPVSAVPLAGAAADGAPGGEPVSCPAWVVAAYGSMAGASSSSPTCSRHGDPEDVSLGVVSRDSRSAMLELKTGGFYALHEASGRMRVFVPGFDYPQDPQAPALPFRRALVDAVVGRSVQLGGVRGFAQVGFPGLVPTSLGSVEMQVSRDGTVRAGRQALRESSPRHLSTDLARLLPSVFQGETKSAVVQITPLRFDARRQQLLLAKRVLVRLLFTGRETGESGRGSFGRRQKPQKPVTGQLLTRLYTKGLGLYAVSFDKLFTGRQRGFASAELRLERQGQAQGFHVEPAGALFGPGSILYFHADAVASSTAFSGEVAWELVRSRDGVQMPLVSAAPSGDAVTTASTGRASFEIERFYQPGLLDAPDPWLWEGLASGTTRAKSFSLAGVNAASSQAALLEVFLQGASESGNPVDHHVSVSLNGSLAGEAQFTGKKPYRISLSVPLSLLHEGANELSLTNVADTGVSSYVFLDRFTVSYPQTSSLTSGVFEGSWNEGGTATVLGASGPVTLLDVTASPVPGALPTTAGGSGGVSWLTGYQATGGSLRFRAEAGHRYLAVSQQALLTPRVAAAAASTLRNTQNQADFLLITPRAFLTAAEPLLERRHDQGLLARAVAFEEISDDFGHGQPSAEAIKSFLAFAFQSWARPSPRYVLLLGDSSYDPRNFTGSSQPSPLPALWTKTSYLWTVSDPELAAVNGDDKLPDLAIGRLPATTVAEADSLVQKLLAWEDSGQGLSGAALLVADNPDLGGDFETDVQEIAQSFLAARNPQVLRLSQLGAQTRPAILDAMNSGLSLLSYVGHGGAAVWASENVWNSWDASTLQAQSHQPFLLTLNCLNGYFVAPSYNSLAESLLKVEGRGAIASFSPSGLSLDGPAHQYHRALMAEVTGGRHQRLGDALTAAQKTYAQTGLMPELLSIYHLLGDPAMSIR
jgi:Peptidase family C25/SdrD B-like domain/Periplasmic copper-binding protein (NosD)